MEIMAQEKAEELRMMIDPPKYVFRTKNSTYELTNLKNQLEEDKNERIKNIYKKNESSYSSKNLRKSSNNFNLTKKGEEKQ